MWQAAWHEDDVDGKLVVRLTDSSTHLVPAMRSKRAQSLKEVLNDWIRSSGLQGPLAKGRVIAVWESMLSPQMKQHVGKAWVRGDRLFVTVTSTVWRQELHMRREEWRQKLNEELGGEMIRELVFR